MACSRLLHGDGAGVCCASTRPISLRYTGSVVSRPESKPVEAVMLKTEGFVISIIIVEHADLALRTVRFNPPVLRLSHQSMVPFERR